METKILNKIILIRNINVIFVIFTLFSTLFNMANIILLRDNNTNYRDIISNIVTILLYLIVIQGINRRKPWVILYVLLLSYGHILISLLTTRFVTDIQPLLTVPGFETGIHPLLMVPFKALSVIYFSYQIFIFSKAEVRNYFKEYDYNII